MLDGLFASARASGACALLAGFVTACGTGQSATAPTTIPESGGLPADALPPLLRSIASGGYVIFFRHSMRDTGVLPTSMLAIVDNAVECVPGSELTSEGMADARALGAAIRRLGISIDRVYASPTCRTTQMASLMFGDFRTARALSWPGMWLPDEEPELTAGLLGLLGQVPAASRNTVLISHNDVLQSRRVGVDVSLDQSEAAVFRPEGNGAFRLVGRIKKDQWVPPIIGTGFR